MSDDLAGITLDARSGWRRQTAVFLKKEQNENIFHFYSIFSIFFLTFHGKTAVFLKKEQNENIFHFYSIFSIFFLTFHGKTDSIAVYYEKNQ